MAYQTYTTRALVCGSWSSNSADKTFLLYTQTLGMIHATARSVREERSRQRYALQDLAEIKVSLVRGRAGWRIGSVIDIDQPFRNATDRAARGSVVYIYRMLRRFVSGSETSPEVYGLVTEALQYLVRSDVSDRAVIQDCVCFRLLHHLGYIAPTPAQRPALDLPVAELSPTLSPAVLHSLREAIAQAETVSHL